MPHTIDVEGRRPVHAAPHPAHEILADPCSVNVLGQLSVEPLDVVLDDRHRRVRRSLNVVPVFADRHRQAGAPLGCAHAAPSLPRFSRARRIPSAPGFTPTGDTYPQRTIPSASITYRARSLVP